MFIGHFAVSFSSKRFAPRVFIAVFVVALLRTICSADLPAAGWGTCESILAIRALRRWIFTTSRSHVW
jgi:hypothetical protein